MRVLAILILLISQIQFIYEIPLLFKEEYYILQAMKRSEEMCRIREAMWYKYIMPIVAKEYGLNSFHHMLLPEDCSRYLEIKEVFRIKFP